MEKEGPNLSGFCMCGCGGNVSVAPQAIKKLGLKKGEFRKFIHGHNNPTGKCCRKLTSHGYALIYVPQHARADQHGYVYEHIFVAETVLGKPLPVGAVVHHANEDGTDNRPGNLIICQDEDYHKFIHVRLRAYKACGRVDWRKCCFCQKYDDPAKMYNRKNRRESYHLSCRNQKLAEKKERNERKISLPML